HCAGRSAEAAPRAHARGIGANRVNAHRLTSHVQGANTMSTTRYLPFVGRLLIGIPFAMSGLGKLAAYGPTTEMIAAAGLPVPPLAFAVAVAVELGGGLLLIA